MESLVLVFFTSLGVVLGASILGSLGGTLTGQPPLKVMANIAEDIKFWGVVAAFGGTFPNLRLLEGSLFEGELTTILRQLLALVMAFIGAELGFWLVSILTGGP